MTDAEKKDLKIQIEAEILKIKNEIIKLKEVSKPVAPDNSIGRITRMDAINQKSISEAAMNSAKARLSNLENALRRIDHEDFGICTECDEEIPIKRLLVRPESTRCVKCTSD
jgi:DnaK suppressor protein